MRTIVSAVYSFLNGKKLICLIAILVAIGLHIGLTIDVSGATFRIAYWKLDELAGGPYQDSENNHDGQCAGGQCPTSDSGQINNGQTFDGSSTGIDVPVNAAFDWSATDSFSIEAWIKGNAGQTCSGSDEVIIGRVDNGSGLNWSLGCATTTGNARFVLSDNSGDSTTLEGPDISDGNWHHVVAVRDGSSNANRFYVDGVEVDYASKTYASPFSSASADINIGYLDSNSYFDGTIDEVALYNGAISETDIQTHYYLSRGYDESCATAVTIMPLGNSITYGTYGSGSFGGSGDPRPEEEVTGYRQPLYLSLTAASYYVDFVGGESAGQSAVPSFDYNHEGHPGWTDTDMVDEVFGFLSNNPAEVVLLHIGTNQVDASAAEVGQILDAIDSYDESITVVLARIINRQNYSQITSDFNNNIETLAQTRIANGDKIIVVDHENALVYPDDLADNLHPNDSGYNKMADVWLAALDEFLPVCPTPATITSTAVVTGTVGQAYGYDVDANGSPVPTYTLSLKPGGMTIDEVSGLISWTPGTSGTYNVEVAAVNSEGSDTQPFTIQVGIEPQIVSTAVTQAIKGVSYGYDVNATGYPTPSYALNDSPAGMTIDSVTGMITWTPTMTGLHNVEVNASNGWGSRTQAFTVDVGSIPEIVSTAVTQAIKGVSYGYDVNATGYPTPSYALNDSPAGMTIDSVTGMITWTPTTTGTFAVEVTANNGIGTYYQGFSIEVSDNNSPANSNVYLPFVVRNGP